MGPRKLLALFVVLLFVGSAAATSYAAPTTTLLSHTVGNPTKSGDAASPGVTVSPNGRYVAFMSNASDLVTGFVDNNGVNQVDAFRFDRTTSTTVLASRAHDNAVSGAAGTVVFETVVTDDGSVFFSSDADNHVNGFVDANSTGNDLFVFSGATSTVRLLTGAARSAVNGANGNVFGMQPSDDGTRVAFGSSATNLAVIPFADANAGSDVFLVDLSTPALPVYLVSHTAGSPNTTGSGAALFGTTSGDGTNVLFSSFGADHVSGFNDQNTSGGLDIYRFNVGSGLIDLVSHSVSGATNGALESTSGGLMSTDGRYVVYHSNAPNLVSPFEDNNASAADVFLYDGSNGKTTLVSHRAGASKKGSNGVTDISVPSATGKHVLLTSDATDLVTGFVDGNGLPPDLYLFTLSSGGIKLVSHRAGSSKAGANGTSAAVGRRFQPSSFSFLSLGEDLVSNFDDNTIGATANVYRYTKKPGKAAKTTVVSHAHDNLKGGADDHCAISADAVTAKVSAFFCAATNLIPGFTPVDPAVDNVYLVEY